MAVMRAVCWASRMAEMMAVVMDLWWAVRMDAQLAAMMEFLMVDMLAD